MESVKYSSKRWVLSVEANNETMTTLPAKAAVSRLAHNVAEPKLSLQYLIVYAASDF